VKTIESFRYLVHPLFIPIINKALLDKSIRTYLLQYQVVVLDRGHAFVYHLEPSQFQEKVYQKRFCELEYPLFDNDLCNRDSCLDCRWLSHSRFECQIFRAKYERKKAETQEERYERNLDEAQKKESSDLTLEEIERLLSPHIETIMKENSKTGKKEVDMSKLLPVLKRKLNVNIGHSKRYDLKALIEFDYYENKTIFDT
jgi:hypothetical protein